MENFSKILKFADKDGNKHSYMANFIDGEISPEDKRNIEKLKNGERLEEKKETSTGDYEVVNDFSIDTIKDNFTPPGAKEEKASKDEKYWGTDLPQEMQDELKNRYRKALKEEGYSDEEIEAGAEDHPNEKLYTLEDFYGKKFWETPEWTSLVGKKEDVKDEIDTNDNGEIEEDEMADFQKSLDDYAAKNKKGRDDIPVTTRR